jgi:hypothetical protein
LEAYRCKRERPTKKEANQFFLAYILGFQMKAEFVLSHSLEDWRQKKKE